MSDAQQVSPVCCTAVIRVKEVCTEALKTDYPSLDLPNHKLTLVCYWPVLKCRAYVFLACVPSPGVEP